MMIKIDAIVREEKFEDVKAALNAIGVNGITVSQVMGCGVQRGYKEIVRGMEVAVQMLPKIKFEIVVSSEEWEQKTIEAIQPFQHRQKLPQEEVQCSQKGTGKSRKPCSKERSKPSAAPDAAT